MKKRNGEAVVMLRNVLIVANDMEKSVQFYKELFGLQVLLRQKGNVILSEGLVLQELKLWQETIRERVIPHNNMAELYFETSEMDKLIIKYESGEYPIKYLTKQMIMEGGQKLVRFYDPSGNLIEVRTSIYCNE